MTDYYRENEPFIARLDWVEDENWGGFQLEWVRISGPDQPYCSEINHTNGYLKKHQHLELQP